VLSKRKEKIKKERKIEQPKLSPKLPIKVGMFYLKILEKLQNES